MAAVLSETPTEAAALRIQLKSPGFVPDRVRYSAYLLALGVSISIWFLAIGAPLWLDETISFFVVKGKFSAILSRQGWPGVPAYPFLLWLWIRVAGSGEIGMRLFSVLGMLGATYVLYRAARMLFERDVAIIAGVIFCLHLNVIFAAIDIRPYPFAALAIATSIYLLVRLRRSESNWLAAMFGLSAACIVYFQFLFVVIVPALAICFFTLKTSDRKGYWRRIGVVLAVFTIAMLPVVPGVNYLFHTSGTHVFSEAPRLSYLGQTLAQKRMLYPLVAVVLIAAATRTLDLRIRFDYWPLFLCLSLALVPIFLLYIVSVKTSIHVFVFRYRLVAVPGVALCWAYVLSRIQSRDLRLLFCVTVVGIMAFGHVTSPLASRHDYSWKDALRVIEKNASADGAPVLLCSDLPESDFLPIPSEAAAKDSALFAPLSYYSLSVPVVPMPRSLNEEAKRAGQKFLTGVAQRHKRFLAAAFLPSNDTLDWLEETTVETHSVRALGEFDGIRVLEFDPLPPETGTG